MKPKDTTYAFEIPKLSKGKNTFEFSVNDEFFRRVEEPIVSGGSVNVSLSVEKSAKLMVIHYAFSGTLSLECDRCLQTFELRVDFVKRVVYSFEAVVFDSSDDEVYEISPNTVWFDAATDIYELLSLAVPMRKVPENCPGPQCPPEVIRFLRESEKPRAPLSELWEDELNMN
jgi:uncharacterized metal-binding protein YceD (DUF177 family)